MARSPKQPHQSKGSPCGRSFPGNPMAAPACGLGIALTKVCQPLSSYRLKRGLAAPGEHDLQYRMPGKGSLLGMSNGMPFSIEPDLFWAQRHRKRSRLGEVQVREERIERNQLPIGRMLVSMVVWLCPAPDPHSLSCLLNKLNF